ncbi:MAG: hypothetical protein EZS28_024643 [Streblomastix strix]|uniref:Uncharacterized protein n=1 Tax=Streblomastix strix TaxID=222440 RepID=A0A5J4VBB4_9EUKA|nr:MAG: hypothetical protein EZS28_024643 [Streblomastix strix]
MSVLSSRGIPDLKIQQQTIGKHSGETQIQNYTQIHLRYDKDRNVSNDQLDLGRDKERLRIISSEGLRNGQKNEDWAEGLHREVERQQLKQFMVSRNK